MAAAACYYNCIPVGLEDVVIIYLLVQLDNQT